MASKFGCQLTKRTKSDLDRIVSYIAVELANSQAASDFIEFLKNWILDHESTGHAFLHAPVFVITLMTSSHISVFAAIIIKILIVTSILAFLNRLVAIHSCTADRTFQNS